MITYLLLEASKDWEVSLNLKMRLNSQLKNLLEYQPHSALKILFKRVSNILFKCITISILEHCEPVCIEKYCQQQFGLLGALK